MDTTKLYEEAILEAKIKVLERELLRLTDENIELREQNAALAKSCETTKSVHEEPTNRWIPLTECELEKEFHTFAGKIQGELNALKKRFDAEVKFEAIVMEAPVNCHYWYRKYRAFITRRIFEDIVKCSRNSIIFKVTHDSVPIVISYNIETRRDARITIDGKQLWFDRRNISYGMVLVLKNICSIWPKLLSLCIKWIKNPQEFTDSEATFANQLLLNGCLV